MAVGTKQRQVFKPRDAFPWEAMERQEMVALDEALTPLTVNGYEVEIARLAEQLAGLP